MNKIYKLIWSKVRNCYVAVCEIAKRNGKGCGIRGLRMSAVTLGVTAALLGGWGYGGAVAYADIVEVYSDETKSISDEQPGTMYYLNGSKITFTVLPNGKVQGITGDSNDAVSGNSVDIGGSVTGDVYGGYSGNGAVMSNGVSISGNASVGGEVIGGYSANNVVSSNTVTISGGTVGSYLFGGYSENGSATGNTVSISGGTVPGAYGGYSRNDSATGNTVNISGGEVNGVYGGYVKSGSGNATGNTVILSKQEGKDAPVLNGTVYGGYSGGYSSDAITGNTLQVEAAGLFAREIRNFEKYSFVLPDSISADETMPMLTLTDQYNNLTVDGSKVSVAFTGDNMSLKLDESITLLNQSGGSGIFSVSNISTSVTERLDGAEDGLPKNVFSLSKPDGEDKLNAKFTEKYLYGDGGNNTTGQREKGNTLNITDGMEATAAYGGRAADADVTGNTVNMTGGTVGDVYGGYSGCGNAGGTGEGEGNTVNISGGKVANDVVGGKSDEGNATGNTVNMTGGTVGCVLGGWSDNGNVTGNKVTISGGTVQGDVLGGWGDNGSATGNTVIISGGTVDRVVGGCGERDGATGNTVSISGGTMNSVYGGLNGYGGATGNTVILSKQEGKAAPVLCGMIGGGLGNGDIVTGNTLQLEAAGLSAPGIKNFETIRLAGTLAWENGATVFKANQFITNADGTRASLDIKDAETNLAEATNGSMTLLASDTADDFKTLSLIYSGGTEALSETNRSKVVKTGEETTEAAPVNGVTVSSVNTHTVSLDAENSYKNVFYTVESMATKLTLGEMAWGTGRDLAGKYTFDDSVPIDAANLTFTGTATTALKKGDSAALVSNATGITADNEVAQPTGDAGKTVAVDYTDAAGIHFAATANGHVAAAKDAVNYVVDGVAVNSVNLAGWNGTTSAVPDGWTAGGATSGTSGGVTPETEGSVTPETEDPAGGLTVETDGMTVPEVEAGKHIDILQANTAGFFTGASINGANTYKTTAFTESDPAQSVTIAGSQGKGVTLNEEKNHIIYASGIKDVDTVTLGRADFAKDAVLFDRSSTGYNYAKVKALGVDNFAVAYDKPETVAAGDTMTLLKANKTLADMAAQTKTNSYEYEPVTGVKVNAAVTGSLAAKGGAVTYRAEENRAGKLTFTNVDWKDSGALLTRPSNIVFAGADVDTAKIHFKNIESLQAKKKMTLVSDFGDSVGTITGNKYTVGTGLEGEGAASLAGSDLIFTAKTGTGNLQPQEQAHKAVMAMEAGIAMLAAGSEHVGMALGGLAAQGNGGPDGTSTFASVGGGASRYETGSHVNTNTWNALVAAGGKKELEKGTLQYGIFGEYGKGNYTLHSSAGRGDGDAYYAGGGLLAKWTNKHNVYAEASFRLGRMSDTASDILHDAAGNGYGYDVHANYYGGHVGFGKVFSYKGGRSLDIYGKYFYTKRDGVNFTAGGSAYDLDSVASSVLRVGARYGTTDRKWNWYGGLAYDYEFDGEAAGKVDGVAIRSASVKGGSVRGELGLRMDATKDNPWKADISVYGYGGKHRGFGGNVSVAYTF